MKYIVSGCTGHLGLNLVKYLLSAGKTVKAIALPGENTEKLSEHGAEVVYGDVTDRDFVFSQVEQGCVFFHLAGVIDITSGNKDKVYLVNVKGTENVADACLAKGARLVYTSSVHVIPPAKKGKVMCEPVSFSPDKVVGDYAKSKTIATKYVFEKCREGLDAVVLYPSGIIGPLDDKVSSLGQLVLDIANRKIRTRVTGGYNFVDVRDVACGVAAAAEKGRSGEGYILSGSEVTIDGIFKIVNGYLKRTGFVPMLATGFVKIFSSIAEAYYRVRGLKPLFTKYSLYTITSNHSFSNQKAVIDLGFNARSADESIIDALNWFFFNKPELLEEKTKKELLAAIEKDEKRKGLAEKPKNALKQKTMRNET